VSSIQFTSEITVELLKQIGSDIDICRSAWVSSGNAVVIETEKRQRGLIRSLMRQKHGSPFEEGFFSFRVYAPRAVRDEHVRHRIGSYSSASLRYNMDDPVLYIPPRHRPLKKVEGFKAMNPEYEILSDLDYYAYTTLLKQSYEQTYQTIEQINSFLDSTESVRWITHDGLMVPYICRFNPRSLMHFLSLRTHDEHANHISYPMWEIEQVARQIEQSFALYLPLTYEAYLEFKREAP
jgi:thymidylate synthase (FAD)